MNLIKWIALGFAALLGMGKLPAPWSGIAAFFLLFCIAVIVAGFIDILARVAAKDIKDIWYDKGDN